MGDEQKKPLRNGNNPEMEKMLPENLEDLYNDMPITDETSCGFGALRGPFLQKFANKKAYVFLYGVVGLIFSASYAYFNGTITTIEKRYKIPSKNTGIISVGNDISALFVSAVLSYYAGKRHRPRWIALGLFTIVVFCLLTALPHYLYGPGEQALSLTIEHGASFDDQTTSIVMEREKKKTLCRANETVFEQCESEEGNFAPQVILFVAQLISGVGGTLYYTLGVAYMDDNIKKSKTPALLSLSYFLRMLGPAIGYTLASFCLKLYISPTLTPTIKNTDPRWLGAWWLGWLVLSCFLFGFAMLIGLFPKTLPRAAVRKRIAIEQKKRDDAANDKVAIVEEEVPASIKDMLTTFKRLLKNKILMYNNVASVFYYFGYMPYWIFTPKYIETQYRQSAATSSLVTGTVALGFSAMGVLLSGLVISKYKPSARYMAAWNVFVGACSVVGMVIYSFLGCTANEQSVVVNNMVMSNLTPTCNSDCHCDYVKYSPVCGENGNTYISACHAGCTELININGSKSFDNCACITPLNQTSPAYEKLIASLNATVDEWGVPTAIPDKYESITNFMEGKAMPGSCPIDCYKAFYTFLIVMCFTKFTGATGRASNFLVSVRCVDEKDKTVAMGFGMMLMSLFSFIPSPIFFGTLMDKTCLVWGKTCSSQGNCWLYDGKLLRFWLNFIAAAFVTVGTLLDMGVWYYVKDLKIFDDKEENEEKKPIEKEVDVKNGQS